MPNYSVLYYEATVLLGTAEERKTIHYKDYKDILLSLSWVLAVSYHFKNSLHCQVNGATQSGHGMSSDLNSRQCPYGHIHRL